MNIFNPDNKNEQNKNDDKEAYKSLSKRQGTTLRRLKKTYK